MDIENRIRKDIGMFNENIKNTDKIDFNSNIRIKHVVELSKMYASDANSYLEKNDLYTSFSCISYAHGLLDAVLEITGEKN
ncbi:MAG: DUF357 domain-containing protein [Candidatus Marsarchaeota archaeon]|nr:DUF357 domain-containing protein [Candidatus Marsarchaeota archaeon]